MIYPDQFIPIIEENGFIRRVDYYIWEEACCFIKKCMEANLKPCPISVNVSRVHLRDDECIRILSDMIVRNDIPQHLLELEITESADNQQVSRKAMQLKEEGFILLMDDFGSGYSSLNILLETPFDVIKLDRKFMENMMVSVKGRLILEQVSYNIRSSPVHSVQRFQQRSLIVECLTGVRDEHCRNHQRVTKYEYR